jgi:hypothetical protein
VIKSEFVSNISIYNILDANKIYEPNFLDQYYNVRIVFKQEKRLYVLKNHILVIHDEHADEKAKVDEDEHVLCVKLVSGFPKHIHITKL